MTVVKVDESTKPKKAKGGIKMRDVVIFTRQFSTMINAGLPLVQGDDVLSVLPGTLEEEDLAARLGNQGGAVIMKVGRNLGKIRRAVAAAGRHDESTTVMTLAEADPARADMATCVIIGSPETRVIERENLPPLVYSPRSIGEKP